MNETAANVSRTSDSIDVTTEYIVLRLLEGTWTEVGRFNARSTDSAIRAACKGYSSDEPSTYVAIPARSFRPVTVKAETRTVLTLDQATT